MPEELPFHKNWKMSECHGRRLHQFLVCCGKTGIREIGSKTYYQYDEETILDRRALFREVRFLLSALQIQSHLPLPFPELCANDAPLNIQLSDQEDYGDYHCR